jgi:hypothetical protein
MNHIHSLQILFKNGSYIHEQNLMYTKHQVLLLPCIASEIKMHLINIQLIHHKQFYVCLSYHTDILVPVYSLILPVP